MLQRHRNSIPINTAHKQPKQTPHSQKLRKRPTINRRNLQHPQNNHVDNHRPLPTEPVPREAKRRSPHTPQQQRQRDCRGDIRLGPVIVLGQFDCLDGEGVEIKGVGGPGAEAHDEEDPVAQGELPQQADGVLDRVGGDPFGACLAVGVYDRDTLFPAEEVAPGLFGCG